MSILHRLDLPDSIGDSPGPVWSTHRYKGITRVYRAATSNQHSAATSNHQHTLEATSYPTTGKVISEDWKVIQRSHDGGLVLAHTVLGSKSKKNDSEISSTIPLRIDYVVHERLKQ